MTTKCGKSMRGGTCDLYEGHNGRHTTVAFYCDVCGKMRRGQPFGADEHIAFCWFCAKENEERRVYPE